VDNVKTSSIGKTSSVKSYGYSAKDKECLARAMFFESNRSSREGLVAVGTVVMNRLRSGRYGNTVCSVVGQKGQFAPGVLSRRMNSKALSDVQNAADAVLKGERHPGVKNAMFFHTAGLRFPYKNMHYVLVAGGNAFYEKRSRKRVPTPAVETKVAEADAPKAPLSYEADPKAVDAIGAMIASQMRPSSH
jgi:spore germination cell wall hydrolase CwlJ-like protein